ncbi:Ig-like domain-containing protein, partial [Olleya namhaensis]|uniref:Ig-like domain-containing protein n=1 Tax=Olleya namhaensis TaxID=1144750 RepID=UPI002493C23F
GEGTWSVDTDPMSVTFGQITFTPESGFTGDPTPITYTVDDNDGGTSAPATVSVDYPVVVPVAVDDTNAVPALIGTPVSIDVVGNDSDS